MHVHKYTIKLFCRQPIPLYSYRLISINSSMSPYTPFRSRRGIHHFLPIRLLESFWFFFVKSSWGMKLILVGIICVFLGLVFPWIQIGDTTRLGAFSLLCGGVGWWMSILIVILLIHFFSYDYSQKIQKKWHLSLDPKDIYLRIGGLIILMTFIVSVSLIGAARTINGNILIQTNNSGLVFTLLGGLFLCF